MADAPPSEGGVRYRWVGLAVAFLVPTICIALIWQAVPPVKQAMAAAVGDDGLRGAVRRYSESP